MAKYGNNLRDTEKFYIGGEATESHDFCLFASLNSIKLVEENIAPPQRTYLMDATFKIRPHGLFRQVLIIHIQWNNNVRSFLGHGHLYLGSCIVTFPRIVTFPHFHISCILIIYILPEILIQF